MVGAPFFRLSAFGAALFLCAAAASGPSAETVTTTEISGLASAVGGSNPAEAYVYSLSEARLSFSSKGASETKGQATVDFKAGDAVVVELRKAWIKARLDELRLTVGKTRLSWGEGALFNAGNVIFGSTEVDLSAEDLRDDNAWLAAVVYPVGEFSFVEAVVLPPDPPFKAIAAKSANPALQATPAFGSVENVSAGGRAYARLGGVKVEAGYLWAGETPAASAVQASVPAAHKPYLSLQGNLWADWHLSASGRLVHADGGLSAEDGAVSAGLYRQWSVPVSSEGGSGDSSLGTFAVRLEALLRPAESWGARAVEPAAVDPAVVVAGGTSLDSPYALLVYPEISWRADTVYAFLRSLVSPIDFSARTAFALQWAPLQGFSLIGSVAVQSGGDGDLFGWRRTGGWQAAVGTKFKF